MESRTAVVFRNEIRNSADLIHQTAADPHPAQNEYVVESARFLAARYAPDALTEMMERESLCEEMKHGINGMRRLHHARATGVDTRDIRSCMRAFNERRLTPTSELRRIHAGQLAEQPDLSRAHAHEDFTNIEECNAKLMRIVIGPDPRASLETMLSDFMTGILRGSDVSSTYREHHGWILSLLCAYAGVPCKNNFDVAPKIRAILSSLPDNQLRLLAHHVFKEEFNERLEDTPFCTLDEEGRLVRHPGTLEYFAQWA